MQIYFTKLALPSCFDAVLVYLLLFFDYFAFDGIVLVEEVPEFFASAWVS